MSIAAWLTQKTIHDMILLLFDLIDIFRFRMCTIAFESVAVFWDEHQHIGSWIADKTNETINVLCHMTQIQDFLLFRLVSFHLMWFISISISIKLLLVYR